MLTDFWGDCASTGLPGMTIPCDWLSVLFNQKKIIFWNHIFLANFTQGLAAIEKLGQEALNEPKIYVSTILEVRICHIFCQLASQIIQRSWRIVLVAFLILLVGLGAPKVQCSGPHSLQQRLWFCCITRQGAFPYPCLDEKYHKHWLFVLSCVIIKCYCDADS